MPICIETLLKIQYFLCKILMLIIRPNTVKQQRAVSHHNIIDLKASFVSIGLISDVWSSLFSL